jgi:hypothetical protein
MSATLTKHTCSCGRNFANEQILKYHQRVSKHEAAEGAVAPATEVPAEVVIAPSAAPAVAAEPVTVAAQVAPVENAYLQAMEILKAKRAEQEAYERNLATARAVSEFVDFAGELAEEGCKFGARAVSTSLLAGRQLMTRLLFALMLFAVTAGLVTAGMGLGSFVATASGTGVAQSVSPSGIVAQI